VREGEGRHWSSKKVFYETREREEGKKESKAPPILLMSGKCIRTVQGYSERRGEHDPELADGGEIKYYRGIRVAVRKGVER